jgi:uncharacterized membrane-anchored protein
MLRCVAPLGAPPRLTRQTAALLASVVLSVGVVGGLMAQKEALLARGRTVLLELAPVDPRSILQGDYMTLSYAAARDVSREGADAGLAVFAIDEQGVGHFQREDDGRPIDANEIRVGFRRRDGAVRFGAQTFLFEEGQANTYGQARYAELRVDDDGSFLLVRLRNDAREILGKRPMP